MRARKILLSLVLTSGFISLVYAENEQEVTYSETLLKKAKSGDAQAQYDLGEAYYNADGVDENFEEALMWYKKAAAKGHLEAEYSTAYLLDYGEGTEENNAEAVKWYNKAAKKGHDLAQYQLALTLQDGEDGVKADPKQAVVWMTKAADNGLDSAQYSVGLYYESGTYVPQDYNKAVKYYKLAVAQGNADAQNNLATLYQSGDGIQGMV